SSYCLSLHDALPIFTNGVNGWLDSRPDRLVDCVRQLIAEPETARQWGQAARELALSRFSIGRFIDDWNHVLAEATRQADSGVMAWMIMRMEHRHARKIPF